MTTQVEALAKYAARAGFADLSQESRRQLPIHILDSLGCCIAALGAGPVQACREQVAEFGGSGPCALIFSRQPLPPVRAGGAAENLVARGAYALAEAEGTPILHKPYRRHALADTIRAVLDGLPLPQSK